MNGLPQQPWHSELNPKERQGFINIIVQSVFQIQGNNSFNNAKTKQLAEDFEKWAFSNARSKKEYVDMLRNKVSSIKQAAVNGRSSMAANAPDPAATLNGMQSMGQQNIPVQPQMQQHQQQNQYMKNNQQQQPQQQQQQQQPQRPMMNNFSNDQRVNLKTAPIPEALLKRIPGLPVGVNTWAQITQMLQNGQINPQLMNTIKQVYTVHSQLLQARSHQDAMQKPPQQPQVQTQPQTQPQPQRDQMFMQQNRMANNQQHIQQQAQNPQFNSKLVQGQQQQQPQQPPQQSATQQPQLQITQEMLREGTTQALNLIERLKQTGDLPQTLAPAQQQSFIKTFIQRHYLPRVLQNKNATANPSSQQANNQNSVPQAVPGFPGQSVPLQQAQKFVNTSPLMNQTLPTTFNNARPMQKPQQQKQPQQSVPSNSMFGALPNAQQPVPNMHQQQQKQPIKLLPGIQATEEDWTNLRKVYAEALQLPIKLKNVTNEITPDQKRAVLDQAKTMIQLSITTENLIPNFFIATKNVEGTRRLIQIKFMLKEVLESLKRNEYLATPNILQRVQTQIHKYITYLKELQQRKFQQLQNVQSLQQQQQQQQQTSNLQQVPQMGQGNKQLPNNMLYTSQTNPDSLMGGSNANNMFSGLGIQDPSLNNTAAFSQQQRVTPASGQQLNSSPLMQTPMLNQNSLMPNQIQQFPPQQQQHRQQQRALPQQRLAQQVQTSPNAKPQQYMQQLPNNMPQPQHSQQPYQASLEQQVPQQMLQQPQQRQQLQQQVPIQQVQQAKRKVKSSVSGPSTGAPGKQAKVQGNRMAATNAAAKSSPVVMATPSSVQSPENLVATKEQNEIQAKEEAESAAINTSRMRIKELGLDDPASYFLCMLSRSLDLKDEETQLLDSKESNSVKKDTISQKGITPSAILQTPLSFIKTPGSSRPLDSPSTSKNANEWSSKVTPAAINAVFRDVSAISKTLSFGMLPTPPEENEVLKRSSDADEEPSKKAKLENKLQNSLWDFDYAEELFATDHLSP
ncbi:RNA polymerase II mediator complex subunit [Komagataella phaffii CBS 7435]|uniref:Mediator of RNA polymerase II transcription subunit 15 n=2 Tax=Komagataella phaffii TaxID=460519 RepID=C4QXL2_KOMPG|nr:Hypothetical protein PAS_chr1-4_0155 [Komagataella phaffii GS115]AOA61130.1 GQ67_02030T0 [Komagataella phaffii]CAH2446799.1 RNA polymerase II mediator complex subunit [Komagataella phaffii CBS 7435]AOA66579.1 GQ68_02045T0 [Komagataella phaffii GS115]CAY67985.1 Hypothetical protein PAS_chr1-4_0155 [Komagataella phaffii GS115]CCA37059.1 RNA polymerase II mediator complex subunit [Komagataella phaffii CBS 7435]